MPHIHPTAKLAADVTVGPNAVVGEGCVVGAGTRVWRGDGRASAIEEVRLGDRVATWLPGDRDGGESADVVLDPGGRREVWLTQTTADGILEVGLLRPAGWLAALGIRGSGDVAILDLPEMGAAGAFAVRSVGPCPAIAGGAGRVVTGVFRHPVGEVYDLPIGGEVIRVTALHPIWSVDRSGWVGATELLPGERVRVAGGDAECGEAAAAGDEPVYNIEVDADHCYRVGEQGILVHNNSVNTEAACECPDAETVSKYVTGPGGRYHVSADVVAETKNDTNPKICRIWSISGPLAIQPARGNNTATTAMRRFQLDGEPLLQTSCVAGHIISDHNGGPNSTWNLVPMTTDFNGAGGWRIMEEKISTCMNTPGTTISMRVDLDYRGTGLRRYVPTKLTVTLTVNGNRKRPIDFPNTMARDPRTVFAGSCSDNWT